MSKNEKEKEELKSLLAAVGIFVLIAVGSIVVWRGFDTYQSHYGDKGYRLCMNYIVEHGKYIDVVKGCVGKYADIEFETDQ